MELSDLTHEQIEDSLSAFVASLVATIGAMEKAPAPTRNAPSFLTSLEGDLEKSIRRNQLSPESAKLVRGLYATAHNLYVENQE